MLSGTHFAEWGIRLPKGEKKMKLLATAIFVSIMTFSPAVLAQTQDSSQASFSFNQSHLLLNLEQKDYETVYRTDQVPDTCYRSEVQGTRTECHTEYDQQCQTRYEQQCTYQPYPVCTRVPRRVCQTTQNCRTQNDQVCNSQGCRTVPRRVCTPVQQCRTENDTVCHTEQRQVCQQVPRQDCQQVPRQVCQQVPNVVQVPYACTRPVQVPVGQQLKLDTVAKVDLTLVNFAEVGALPDLLTAQLVNGQVSVSAANAASSAYLYQIVGQQRSEQVISNTEKVVTYTISVKAISIQQLNALLNSTLVDTKVYLNRIEFSYNTFGAALPNVALKGHLKVLQQKNARKAYIIVDQDFTSNAIVSQGTAQIMMMNSFGVNSLVSGKLHTIQLSLGLDLGALQTNLINPDALKQVPAKTLQAQFQGTPISN